MHIQIKALFLLLIFSANVSAMCRCNHDENTTGKPVKSCCAAKKQKPHCNKKSSCTCEKKIVKFYQLEKQVAEKEAIAVAPLSSLQFEYYNIPPSFIYNSIYLITNKELWEYYCPPDYCILYQKLSI